METQTKSIFDTDPYQPKDETPFEVGGATDSPVLSPDNIQDRSFRIKYGLGDIIPQSKDEIYQSLQNGDESMLRDQASGELDKRRQAATEGAIAKATANKQGPLTPEESEGIRLMITDLQKGTDPKTVFETAYGKQFVGTLDSMADKDPHVFLNEAKQKFPEETADLFNRAGTMAGKQAVIHTMLQDVTDEIKGQGWIPWGLDKGKFFIPGYVDYALRGNVREPGIFAGGGLGENLARQRQELFNTPTVDEFHDKLKPIVDQLRANNPSAAKEFLEAMRGLSSSDAFVKNLEGPTSLIGTGIGTGIAKAGKAAIMGVDRALVKDTTKAVQDMVRAAGAPDASKSTIEAAAGNLSEAAVTRVTTNAVAETQNVPRATERAVESLPEVLRADQAQVAANPGRYGQDLVNRLEESTNNMATQVMEVVKNVQKVERLPEVMANETAVRAIMESVKDTYKGLRNSVIEVTKPYKEPVANTYLIDMHLGNPDGTYFKSRTVAENFIEHQGLRSGTVEEGLSPAFTKPEVQKAKLNKNIEDAGKIIARENPKVSDAGLSESARTKASEQVNLSLEYISDQKKQLSDLAQTATVEQQGLGYYVKVTKPINETDDVIRKFVATTTNTRLPSSPISQYINAWIGKYRTPEEVLPSAERQNRLAATYAPSEYFKVMVDNAKEIKALQANRFSKGRQRWEEWQDGLLRAQELPDPLDPSGKQKGYFFQDPVEMEQYWLQWFKRIPDQQEVAAYFEFKRGMEVDRIFRNIVEHRNQQRVGAETHSVVALDKETGKAVNSPEFSGVTRRKIPTTDDSIVIMKEKLGDEQVLDLQRMSVHDKGEWQKEIDAGRVHLVELYNPELRPLSGYGNVGDTRVRYVLSPSVQTRELDWNQIPRRGGGHVQYDYENYLKQAKMKYDDVGGRWWYEGDTTIMPVQLRRMGTDIAKHLNEVRKLLKGKNNEEAKDYSNKNLHIDWDVVEKWFQGAKDDAGVFQPPRLSVNEDIHVVRTNQKTIDIDDSIKNRQGFKDGTKEGSLARQNQVEFSGERDAYDLFTLADEGSRGNPLYKVSPVDKVDPVTVLNRGLARIARSNFMDDYRTMAVEHWLQQAAPYLDAHVSEIKHSPYYYFYEGKFTSGTPPEIRSNLEAAKYHMQQFVGQPSLTDGLLHSTAQSIADSLYGTFGPKALVVEPQWLLPKLKDPFKFVRSIVFDSKLGLFNIPQFIVQMGNYANIFGIAGSKYAAPGTAAAQMHFWSTVNSNPNIIKHLDQTLADFNIPGSSKWKVGEFEEAFKEGHNTGFFNVGKEYAALDSPTSNKIVKTATDTFLDWGRYPFQAGETNSRYGSWYTAYREFRDANPTGRITSEDRANILQRADLLSVNMSRASSSAIHSGIWSIPTQFYTYQIRLLELFLGSRLTSGDKMRMFATNAALFGIPLAGGLTGLPVSDYIRTKAMEQGYVVGDNFLKSMLMEGVPAMLGAVITGKGDPQAGTVYDVGGRFGTKGLEFLGSVDRKDKSYLDTIGGAAYSVTKDTIAQSDGFRRAMISLIKGDGDVFPMTTEDVVDVFKEITTVNTAWRTIAAINGGRWVSKKDAYLTDTSGAQAMFSAVTGLKSQNITDLQTMSNSLKSQHEYEQGVEEQFRQEFRRGMVAQNDNPELAKKFFTRAQAWLAIGGYREDQIPNLVNKAINDNTSVLDKVNFDFYIRKAPDSQKSVRMDAMKRTQELQEKRGR